MAENDDLLAPLTFDEAAPEQSDEAEVVEQSPQPEAPAKEAEPEAEKEPTLVPVGVVKGLREENQSLKAKLSKLDDLERTIAALTAPKPVQEPDFFDDPEGRLKSVERRMEEMLIGDRIARSRHAAETQYGAEFVQQVVDFFNDPSLVAKTHEFKRHPDPMGAAIQFYRAEMAKAEIGGDPDAWRERERERLRQEIKAEMAAQSVTKPAAAPASLAGQPNLGSRQSQPWNGPTPLDDILGNGNQF